MKRRYVSCIPFICLLIAGCGGVKYGEVSGTVTYNGSPVPAGTLTFYPLDGGAGAPAAATIEEDGSYTATVPVGEATVTVETESVKGKSPSPIPGMNRTGKGGKANPLPGGPPPEVMEMIKADLEAKRKASEGQLGTYVKINPMYAQPKTSDLKTTVKSGQQVFNINLK